MTDCKTKKAAFCTLGCKVNIFDSEAMAELFEKAGYEIVAFSDTADVYVVNTCTVTHLGDRKSRNMLRRAKKKNPQAIIVAAGCYAQVAPEELMAIPEVDLVLGTQDRRLIVDLVESCMAEHKKINAVRDNMQCRDFETLEIATGREHTRAFLKIQEGCDQFCTYCIIPYARGRVRSRDPQSVLEEVSRLEAQGYKEIVLTGIHIASYGKELEDDLDLVGLIEQIAALPFTGRIRLGSLEPLMMRSDAVERLAAIPNFCPHFHLSLQSGSDTVLKRMHRRYTTAQYAKVVELIRKHFEKPAITTDIMVGFPGETDTEFEETMKFVRSIGFYQIHVFKYSRRKGTPAASMEDQVDDNIKNQRSTALIELSNGLEQAFLEENSGTIQPVLLEQQVPAGFIEGYTPNYIPVYIKENENNCGKILRVALSYNRDIKHMQGEPV